MNKRLFRNLVPNFSTTPNNNNNAKFDVQVQCGSGIIEQGMLAPTIFKPLHKRGKCNKALSINNMLEFDDQYEKDKSKGTNDIIHTNYSLKDNILEFKEDGSNKNNNQLKNKDKCK